MPHGMVILKMSNLYELTTDYLNILDLIEDETIPFDIIQNALQTVEADITVKAENICKLERSLKADEEKFTAEIKRLQSRQKAIKNRRDALRKYLKEQMEKIDKKKIKCGTFSISIKTAQPSLIIDDESLISAQYLTVIPEHTEVQKDVVKADLKAGKTVPGAHLEQSTSLTIR
jgi:hypothetical protein